MKFMAHITMMMSMIMRMTPDRYANPRTSHPILDFRVKSTSHQLRSFSVRPWDVEFTLSDTFVIKSTELSYFTIAAK